MNGKTHQAAEFLAQTMTGLSYEIFDHSSILESLPLWIAREFIAYQVKLSGQNGSLLLLVPEANLEVERVATAYRLIKSKFELPVLVVVDSLSHQVRSALTRMRIESVLTGQKVFSPSLGLVLRRSDLLAERGGGGVLKTQSAHFSSKAREIMLAAMLKPAIFEQRKFSLSELGKELAHFDSHTSFLMGPTSTAVQQLAQLDAVSVKKEKRFLEIEFRSRQQLWEIFCRHSENPVIEKITLPQEWWRANPQDLLSGESALSVLGDLRTSSTVTYALFKNKYQDRMIDYLADTSVIHDEKSKVVVEKWAVNPYFLSGQGCVNPLELALSLQNETDDRIRLQLRKLIEELELNADRLWNR